MNKVGSRSDQLTAGCSQEWARSILSRFCIILEDNQMGMKLDLIHGTDEDAQGMVLILTAGRVPPFIVTYEEHK